MAQRVPQRRADAASDPKRVLTPDDVRRAVTRMAHEIIERNRGLDGVVADRDPARWGLAGRARSATRSPASSAPVPVGSIDASLYRDDIGLRPVVAGAVERHPDRPRRRHRRARRRRAVHRAHRAGRARRGRRLRPPAAPCSWRCWSTAATASCRSVPTSSARTCRPRRRGGPGRSATRCVIVDEARVKHLRSIAEAGPDGVRAAARPHRPHGRGQPAPEPEGAGAARQDGVQPVLRGLDADPPQLRDRRQAAVGRHDDVQRRRRRASTRARACATRSRRSPRWASTPS